MKLRRRVAGAGRGKPLTELTKIVDTAGRSYLLPCRQRLECHNAALFKLTGCQVRVG